MSKRQCKGTNKAGEPCKSPPLKGQLVCSAHNRESATYAEMFAPGHKGRGGRPPILSDAEVLANAIRERADELFELAFLGTRTADAYRFIALLFAYGFGRPRQSMELTGADGGPIMLAPVADETRLRLVYSALEEGQPVALPVAANGNGRH